MCIRDRYNPITETYLSAFRRELPHAVLLDGAPGMGLLSTARDIAGKNLSGIVSLSLIHI